MNKRVFSAQIRGEVVLTNKLSMYGPRQMDNSDRYYMSRKSSTAEKDLLVALKIAEDPLKYVTIDYDIEGNACGIDVLDTQSVDFDEMDYRCIDGYVIEISNDEGKVTRRFTAEDIEDALSYVIGDDFPCREPTYVVTYNGGKRYENDFRKVVEYVFNAPTTTSVIGLNEEEEVYLQRVRELCLIQELSK